MGKNTLGDDLAAAAMMMAREMARKQDEAMMRLYGDFVQEGRSIWKRPIWVDPFPHEPILFPMHPDVKKQLENLP